MQKRLWFLALAAMPWIAAAQATIDGVWKTDPRTVSAPSKPSRYIVDAGQYRCESCAPRIRMPADGKPRPVPGHPHVDSLAARAIDDHTFEVSSVAGRVSTIGKMTVSADGRSMVREITSRESNGTTSSSTEMLVRVGAPPKRGHVVSGTWKFATMVKMTDETITFKTAAGTLSMNGSDGSSYDAQLDGTKAPVRRSPGTEFVSVTARNGTTYEEVSYAGDKPVWVSTMVIAPDGATMKVTWEDKLSGAKGTFVMNRQ